MKITRIRSHAISVALNRVYWMSLQPYRTASEIIVEVETDEGVVGLGQIHGRPMKDILDILAGLEGFIAGMDALAHEAVWQRIFALTTTRAGAELDQDIGQPHFGAGKRPQILAALAGIDIALWDIKGKALGLPVWRLLGGTRKEVFAYASGGYYEEDNSPLAVVDEMANYVSQGFKAVKMKCGGLDVAGDVERIEAVREAIDGAALMLDANSAYSLPDAEAAIKAFEPYDIFWFEEPLHWYDAVRGLGKLATRTRVPLASGESEIHFWACRDLIDHGNIAYMQFDATRAGGVTEWLRVAAYAEAHGVRMVPHHDPQIHGHLVAAAPNGFGVETFPRPERDPLWPILFTHRAEIEDGLLRLTDESGFGFGIDWKVVDRYRV